MCHGGLENDDKNVYLTANIRMIMMIELYEGSTCVNYKANVDKLLMSH